MHTPTASLTMTTRVGILIFLVGLASCASSGAKPAAARSGVSQWSGSFRGASSATSAVLAPSTPNRGSGSITLTALGGAPAQTRVEVSISGAPSNSQLGWAIFGGACGSPAPAVTGQNAFQPISVSSGGDGHIRADMTFTLDPKGAYHANVYWTPRANDMNDVMMCANLSAN
jgi:hypothetical protein